MKSAQAAEPQYLMEVFAMKLRLKFSKEGRIKFVGHLDLLRLFQRVIKSAQIPMAYSQGFNPHPLLYFAQALSVGITSEGEYLDIHLEEDVDPAWVKNQMNSILAEGLKIQKVSILKEESKTCMALIDASSYSIYINKDSSNEGILELSQAFYGQEEILVTRKTKKKERVINIKEFIYDFQIEENEDHYRMNVTLAAGSRKNLNAKLFIEAFIKASDLELAYQIHREELFALEDGALVPLWKIGV